MSDGEPPRPLGSQRDAFDLPDGLCYLNCAYMSPQPTVVTAAGEQAVRAKAVPTDIGASDFFAPVEALREAVGAVLGGDPEGVALVPGVSYGIGVAAANLPVAPGERIVVLAEQFPSNVYPWRRVAAETGGRVDTIPRPASDDWTAALLERMDGDVAVVAVPPCHWTDGSRLDLHAVRDAADEAGAALVVDASQALGAMPLDVRELRPDFVVAVAYKWLFGPYGLALLWVAERHRDGRPLEEGWITRRGAEDFAGLVDYVDDYAPGARRFDMGERSAFVRVAMARAALGRVLDWGVERIAARTGRLLDRLDEGAGRIGLRTVPAGGRARHLTGIRLPEDVDLGALADRLGTADVAVSVRGRSVRVSPNVYNVEADVDRLCEVLDDVT